jgi:chaperonin GroEL
MADKQLIFNGAAQVSLMRGVDELGRVVGLTLGPSGRNVLLSRMWTAPAVCSKGVTIAKELGLPDACENLGAQLVQQAASKTNDLVGDGTSTAIVLAQAIIRHGFMSVAAGANGMVLKRGIDKAVETVVEVIRKMAIPVESREQIDRIAAISAHEVSIASRIAKALAIVGLEGVITVEESNTLTDELEFVEGMRLDRGYISHHFATDSQSMEAVLHSPLFLITDQRISLSSDIVPAMEIAARVGGALVVIAENVEAEALAVMVANKLRGGIKCVAIKASGFGERRKALLQDLAVVTDATVITADTGLRLNSVEDCHLGSARRLVASKEESTIIEGRGSEQAIQERVERIRAQINESTSDYDEEQLRERSAALAGGIAVIKVGAATEPELTERKARVEDALSSARAALEEGIVAGGGVAMVRSEPVLLDLEKQLVGEEALGVRLVREALSVPLVLIAENAGYVGKLVLNWVRQGEGDWGFDAERGEYVHLVKHGIIDSVKVIRSALQNAGSVSGMLLTTQAVMAEISTETPLPADMKDFVND